MVGKHRKYSPNGGLIVICHVRKSKITLNKSKSWSLQIRLKNSKRLLENCQVSSKGLLPHHFLACYGVCKGTLGFFLGKLFRSIGNYRNRLDVPPPPSDIPLLRIPENNQYIYIYKCFTFNPAKTHDFFARICHQILVAWQFCC